MKIITVVGARPQFVKAAVLSRLINEKYSEQIEEIIIHTGQHYDNNMSEIFFTDLQIPNPKYNLNIGSGLHGLQTGRMISEIEKILILEKPDIVNVYGDTNSTLAASIAASKLQIPLSHVEAGLRSFNFNMPEEINRILTDRISQYLFCPTVIAIENLKKEDIFDNKKVKDFHRNCVRVYNTGDIMYDAMIFYKKIAENKTSILDILKLEENSYILATIHRAENTDNIEILSDIIRNLENIPNQIVLALHPRTRKIISDEYINIPKNIYIIEPVGYLDMIMLEKKSKIIITDSGGVQKEAYFLKKPCITLRCETEWVETVKSGWNFLIGSDFFKLSELYNSILKKDFNAKKQPQLYGDGNCAEDILKILIENF